MKKILVMVLMMSTSSMLCVGSYTFFGSQIANPIARTWQQQYEAQIAAKDYAALEALCNDPNVTAEQLNNPQLIGDRQIEELPLIMATWRVEWRDILIRLLKLGANPNLEYGVSPTFPLNSAVSNNNIPALRCLLEYGAQTNFRDRLGNTALMSAVRGNLEAVHILLNRSQDPADPNIADKYGYNSLMACLSYMYYVLPHESCNENKKTIIRELLNHGAYLNLEDPRVRQFVNNVAKKDPGILLAARIG